MPRRQAPVKLKVASLKTLSDATFEILGQFFRRVVSILAPNGVKKIAELGNSLRRLHKHLSAARRDQLARFEKLCREFGETQSTVSLAWLLQNPVVTAPIIGPRTIEQLESAVHALDVHLSADTLEELDNIFPPVGSAPEAYAW